MPASPIIKEITLPDNWVHLQKTMIPDSETSCYWSVWYDVASVPVSNAKNKVVAFDIIKATAWLMCCPFGNDPSVNDSWGHAEEIDDECRDVLTAIESVYKVSFHESILADA